MGSCESCGRGDEVKYAIKKKKSISDEDRIRIETIISYWCPWPEWDRDTSV